MVRSRVMDSWVDCDDDDDDKFSSSSVEWQKFDIGTIAMTARNYVLYRIAYPVAEKRARKLLLMVDHEFYPRISMLLLLWWWRWKRIKRNDALSAFLLPWVAASVAPLLSI